MIDIAELERFRQAFLLLSQVIDFPDGEVQDKFFLEEAKAVFPEVPEKEEFLKLLQDLSALSLQEVQENYTRLFELNKRITLYCTYYKFEDSRERGTALAKLKMLYEMFGVELDMAEMTDYLPTMLEFLGLGDWAGDSRIEDLQFLFSVLEDGTYEILAHAEEFMDEPYIKLVRLIRVILRYSIKN